MLNILKLKKTKLKINKKSIQNKQNKQLIKKKNRIYKKMKIKQNNNKKTSLINNKM